MKQIKINILVPLKQNPWGGGNQFLKALKNKLIGFNCYEESPLDADVILFNSYPFRNEHLFKESYRLKRMGKVIIHRVAGPFWHTRGGGQEIDDIIIFFNRYFADGTVFQSSWARAKHYKRKWKPHSLGTVILNAPDPKIFYPSAYRRPGTKIKIICTNWSKNSKKGFDIYQFLDENLNFDKYQFTFIGHSPIRFKNIFYLLPLNSQEVASQLREHDLFITASLDDSCSNALLEALHCGLPAVARNSGGHPKIIGKGGELFNDTSDTLAAIDRVASNPENYRNNISVSSIEEIAQQYYDFCEKVALERGKNPSVFLPVHYLNLMRKVHIYKLQLTLKEKLQKNLTNHDPAMAY